MLHPKSFYKIRNQLDPLKQPIYDNILLRKMRLYTWIQRTTLDKAGQE